MFWWGFIAGTAFGCGTVWLVALRRVSRALDELRDDREAD